jgi:hypothetical protein
MPRFEIDVDPAIISPLTHCKPVSSFYIQAFQDQRTITVILKTQLHSLVLEWNNFFHRSASRTPNFGAPGDYVQ